MNKLSYGDYQNQIAVHDLSKFSIVYVIPLADLHEGARDADHTVSDGYIRWIAEHENAFAILNGDLLNCAWKESTPELFEDLITPDEAYQRLLKRLLPIKDRVLMLTTGGHESAIFRKVGIDLSARLAHDLGDVPYTPECGMVGLILSKNNNRLIFYGYATHGWGGARTIGAKVKKVEELAWAVDADFYVLSHDHTQNIHRFQVLSPPGRIFKNKPLHMRLTRKILVNTGGFIEYSGYARRKGYVPSDLGTPRIRLEVRESGSRAAVRYYKDLHASI